MRGTSPSYFGNRPTLIENAIVLSFTYAKMLSFGERGYCDILLKFGNQHVTRFQQLG
jgi:hypothetical protein